jgi:hypothetical protein
MDEVIVTSQQRVDGAAPKRKTLRLRAKRKRKDFSRRAPKPYMRPYLDSMENGTVLGMVARTSGRYQDLPSAVELLFFPSLSHA